MADLELMPRKSFSQRPPHKFLFQAFGAQQKSEATSSGAWLMCVSAKSIENGSCRKSAGLPRAGFRLLLGRMKNMFTKTRAFLSDERGQDLVEYSLLCVIIGGVVVAYLTGVGTSLHSLLSKISASLDTVDKTLP